MDSLPIITRTYEAYKAIIDMNMKLPKRWLHSLGMSLENTILELLSQLIMAKNAPKTLKCSYLLKASSLLEISRLKLRLLLEFHLTNETKVFQIQALLEEVGKMIGGWMKSLQSQQPLSRRRAPRFELVFLG